MSVLFAQHLQGMVIPIEKKILFTLWQLAKPESFLAAGDRFGLAKSSGHTTFLECVTAINNLRNQLIAWPLPAERERTATVVEAASGKLKT